jgi:hypothetical protein
MKDASNCSKKNIIRAGNTKHLKLMWKMTAAIPDSLKLMETTDYVEIDGNYFNFFETSGS